MYKISDELKSKVDDLPQLPGCYMYLNKSGEIIYVGKAIKLRNRVKSYFINYERLDPKTQSLIENIHDFNFLTVDSEIEALILETNLIKKYHPKYNRMMMDDKNYSWIKILVKEDIPRIKIVREFIKDGSEYFGPYPASFPAKDVLRKLRKLFNYRSCNREMKQVGDKIKCSDPKPCLYYHLGLCKAPCANKISKLEYRKSIYNIAKFLRGEKGSLVQKLEFDMQKAAKLEQFERASVLRDRLQNVKYVLARVKMNSDVDDVYIMQKKDQERLDAVYDLFDQLGFEKTFIDPDEIRIECYDISNIQGTNPVGAMVSSRNGIAAPDLYRKFKINIKQTPDDFRMHQEMMERRIMHFLDTSLKFDNSFSRLPDLMIIDGGKGQLSSVYEILEKYNMVDKINLCSLAKRDEEIFIVKSKKEDGELEFERVKLSKRSECLQMVQRLRDESHRFGITFHKKLRSKHFFSNSFGK